MRDITLTLDNKTRLNSLLGQTITSVDIPKHTLANAISELRITLENHEHIIFGVRSVDLAEGVEVFVLDIFDALDIGLYPRSSAITWHPLIPLTNWLEGSVLEGIRTLSADWQVASGASPTESYYGKNPLRLEYDFSGDQAKYRIDDGVILFLSNGSALTITATGTLSSTLQLWYSKSDS